MFHSRGFYTTSRRLRLCNKQGRAYEGVSGSSNELHGQTGARHYRNPIKCITPFVFRRFVALRLYVCTAVAINRSNKRRQWWAIRSVSPRKARQRSERAASKSREQPESERKVKATRRWWLGEIILSTAIDTNRGRLRFSEIGPARTMPQIIIGPGSGGEPAFNRPYDWVLIMEGHTRYKREYTYVHAYAKAGTSTAVCPQRARMHIFLATVRDR